MNNTNLHQVDGGTVIKQGDKSSPLAFELRDENEKAIDLEGKQAIVTLAKEDVILFETVVVVVENKVSFTIDKVLPVGKYVLEISCEGYVFPSDRKTKITVMAANRGYVVADDLSEVLTKLSAKKFFTELGQVASYDDTAILERLSALEGKGGSDTLYDDTQLKARLERLENKPDNDTIYDDSALRADVQSALDKSSLNERRLTSQSDRLTALEQRTDKDTIYDDSQLKNDISKLSNDLDKLKASSLTTDIEARLRLLEHQQEISISRRPPTSWGLDRTDAKTYKVMFDNGVVMYRKNDRSADTTGYGEYNFPIIYRGVMVAMLPYQVVWLSNGSMTLDEYKSKANGLVYAWQDNLIIDNPVNDSKDFDFSQASLGLDTSKNAENARQKNAIKHLYEIGALSEREILTLGAVKK